jgi:BirA family biotin operon repressor/biotin-[acetyl-CoA-carboxylase] ligase
MVECDTELPEIQGQLIRMLAHGAVISGADLAYALGISRTAIWKRLRQLTAMGIRVVAVRGRGYRLAEPLELLDQTVITAGLPQAISARLDAFHFPFAVDSTNAMLMRLPLATRPRICLAELQWAGRGRRGRVWHTPVGAQIPLSMSYAFAALPADFPALGLAVGVMVAKALTRLGIEGIGIKWPNDLVWQERKLGGVLIEMRGEACGPCEVVVGVGINVNLPERSAARIDQPWTDLTHIAGSARPHRNQLAQALIVALVEGLDQFAAEGLAPFLPAFQTFDALVGRCVQVEQGDQWHPGIALGINERGGLLVRDSEGIRTYWSGEVSVREMST